MGQTRLGRSRSGTLGAMLGSHEREHWRADSDGSDEDEATAEVNTPA
eukprot:COSAG04_NODE_951_length_9210_cov_890.580178_5_plen_47_part_00